MTLEGLAYAVGLTDDAEVAIGSKSIFGQALPMVFSEKTAVSRINRVFPQVWRAILATRTRLVILWPTLGRKPDSPVLKGLNWLQP